MGFSSCENLRIRLLLSSVRSASFASRYRLSVAFGSKVVDRIPHSTTKYANHTKTSQQLGTSPCSHPVNLVHPVWSSSLMDKIYRIEEEDRSLTKAPSTQSEEQHGNAFPSVSISVHQWLNVLSSFMVARPQAEVIVVV